jgi:hypothetical protein
LLDPRERAALLERAARVNRCTLRAMRFASVLLFVTACASAPPPSAATPPARVEPATTPPSKPEVAEHTQPAEPAPLAVPPPPPECAPYLEAAAGCGAAAPLAPMLAAALELEGLAQDRALACVENVTPNLASVLRALRAELAPIGCADALVTPLLESGTTTNARDENTLIGLLTAARLSRLVGAPPALAPPFDKASFMSFFERELRPWTIAQATAVGQLSLQASRLSGYGKAVAAIESALSDLRFVRSVRAVPLPAELASDADVKNVYYAALDEALEPRKTRGRDAALVALRLFSELGALSDPRVQRARSLLTEVYGGSRVDALDRLLLPEPPPLAPSTVERRLARRLPPYYAAALGAAIPELGDPTLARDYLEQGFSPPFRTVLDAKLRANALDPETRFAYALFEARRGATYFAAPAFAGAAELLTTAPKSDGVLLLEALALALRQGPRDVVEVMAQATAPRRSFGSLDALDAIANGKGRYRGEAAFDAAYLRMLAPRPENAVKFWQELAESFTKAARALQAPAARALANEYSDSARKTAQSLARRR